MSRRILFTLLSFLLIIPLIVLVPKVLAQSGMYTVAGYVFDDLNANGRYDVGEPGIPGTMIYADNSAIGYKAYTDTYGYWRMEVPAGQHSIEIYNAGASGSKPTTGEKVVVTGSNTAVQFGVQQGGYAVEGYAKDQYGRPVVGATVYVDLPNRQNVTTNAGGYYRIDNVGYDQSTPIYGQSGGHNIYVQGYDTNPVLVNPQYTAISTPANLTVRTDQESPYCGPTYARDPYNPSNCAYFPNRCSLPVGWVETGSCTQYPSPGTCTEGQVISTTQRCNGQYLCTYETVQTQRYGNCTTHEKESNCNLSSQCMNTSPVGPGPQQCTPGQPAGQSYSSCNGQLYCTITPRYSDSNCSVYNDTNCQYMYGYCGYQSQQPYYLYSYDTYQAPVDDFWNNNVWYDQGWDQQSWVW